MELRGPRLFGQNGQIGQTLAGLWVLLIFIFVIPGAALGRIYIDVNAPSVPEFNIAIPDFKNMGGDGNHPELSVDLAEVVANDLDLSGYFRIMDKAAFLEDKDKPLKGPDIRFKNWSVIGAELLLKGGYVCIGRRVEIELRLYDVYLGRQILGKRALGNVEHYRHLMHRLSNEIILRLTGHEGIALTKLAYVGNNTGHREIYVSDYDGYNVRPLTAYKSISLLPRWSPNGKRIAYNSYKDGGAMLYLRDMASGRTRRLSGRSGLNIGAAWAPDGQEMALTMSYKGNPDIFLINLKGKILEQLVTHWGIDVSPAFSPDGEKIAFVSNRSGAPQIYIMELGSGKVNRLTFEGNYNTSPAWSSKNRIAFTSMEYGRFNICTINPDGSRLRKLTENQGNNEDPCWSPNGLYIAFSSNREGKYHIYITHASGHHQRRVTFQKGDQTSPSWAPE